MCGRFGLFAQPSAIEERFDATFTYDYEPRYNVAPEGPGLAAVRNASPGAIVRLRWGLLPHWVDDPDDFPTLINARAETAADKPAFRDAFARRRCLVPASTFFEWTGPAGGRVPHAIGVDGEPLFAMAGLWETWGEGDDAVRSATILTTDANDVVAELHDRMPVILDREEERTWLAADDADELEGLLDPFPAGRTEAHEVSRAVNDPSNDGPSLVEPVGTDQSGLGEFV